MEEIKLDWDGARVEKARLSVPLAGDASKEWRLRFEHTAQLLNHGSWKTVEVKKGAVHVETVAEGDEDRVRHFLESALLEANSALAADEHDEEPDDGADDERATEHDSPDTRMTERFQGFAPEPGEESDPE